MSKLRVEFVKYSLPAKLTLLELNVGEPVADMDRFAGLLSTQFDRMDPLAG